ncbi:MAG: hypothetical protein M0P01_13575, partial [Treponema sp.]|nr:hypothetical protein [Treponema sp.]
MGKKKDRAESEETALVQEVKSCRACPWFWRDIPPYGPYPAFDWTTSCPEAARRILPQSSDEKPVEWMDAVS